MSLMGPEGIRKQSMPNKFGVAIPFWNKPRFDSFLALLGPLNPDGTSNVGIPRVQFEWNRVINTPSNYAMQGPINPFYIPSTYDEPEEQAEALAIVDNDFNACVDLALKWMVLGDTVAATTAVNILAAWSTITSWNYDSGSTTKLVWVDRVPKLIQAHYMLNAYTGYTTTHKSNFKALIQLSIDNNVNDVDQSNNIGAWGACFNIAAAGLLNNRKLMDDAIFNWASLFNRGVENNIPIDEVYRSGGSSGDGATGLWYSNFFVYALTMGAEWARYNGEWLYDHISSKDGSTFRGLVEQVRYWTRYPWEFPYNTSEFPTRTIRTLPHDEITHALWPNEESQWLLDNFPNGDARDSIGARGSVLIYRNRPLYG